VKSIFYSIITFVLIYSCGDSGKSTVETGEAMEAALPSDSASLLLIDTATSVVTWIGSKPTGKHNGTISITSGTIAVTDSKIEGANFTFSIPSLKIMDMTPNNEFYTKLYDHLMSADFFLADSFPDANFELVKIEPFDSSSVSSKIEYETENKPASMYEFMVKNPTHNITGNLTMRGVSKSIKFPAAVIIKDGQIKAEGKFIIDRTHWNLKYRDEASVADRAKDKFIYNTVNVGFVISTQNEPNS